MTSLSEAYGERGRSTASLRRLYLGVGLFVAGALMVVAGILAAGTDIVAGMEGYSLGDARLYGGVLGGVGVPLVLLGLLTVLPADRSTRAAAVVGAAVSVLGVALFAHAYPCQWIGNTCAVDAVDLTLPTAGVYFLGMAASFWCLFVGVANFKTRNDPGGTVTMEVTHKGETKVVEVERDQLGGLGGMGFLGGTPDGEVETQTNGPDGGGAAASDDGAEVSHTSDRDPADRTGRGTRSHGGAGPGTPSASDGGEDERGLSSPMDRGDDDDDVELIE